MKRHSPIKMQDNPPVQDTFNVKIIFDMNQDGQSNCVIKQTKSVLSTKRYHTHY